MIELVNGQCQLDPDLLTFPQFRAIWDRDKSDGKEEAIAYVSYIFNFYNPKSPFFNYVESDRKVKIIEKLFPAHMQDVKLWDDKEFIQAADIYKEMLALSPVRAVLEIAKEALHEISTSLKSSKTKTTTKLANIGKLTEAYEKLKKLQKLCDEDEVNNVKGARTVRRRERAD